MLICILIFVTNMISTNGFRLVCYFSNSAQTRPGAGTFKPENINPFLCTHIVFSYAAISGLTLQQSEWNDDTTPWLKGSYECVIEARISNPKLKILLAVGKDTENADLFLQAASEEESRVAFAENVAEYIRSRKFDGAQLEWGNLVPSSQPGNHKHTFLLLVKELKRVFKTDPAANDKPPLLLTATLPAKKDKMDTFNIKDIVRELDFISVRTINMRTAADRKVGLSAALFSDPRATGTDIYLSVKWVATYYVSLGVPRDKITIGIPTFGRTFTLGNPTESRIGSLAIDDGDLGQWTALVGIIGYFELCDMIRLGGKVNNVPAQKGRYYTRGSQWISYEDVVSVIQKTCFVQKEQFGGITFWTLDLDDFIGESSGQTKFPLITTAVSMMQKPNPSLCDELNPSQFVTVPVVSNKPVTTTPDPGNHKFPGGRVVCYFTNWARFRRGRGQFLPENINPAICTHIVYLCAKVKGTTITPFYPEDDSEPWREGLFSRVLHLKKENPHLMVLLSVGYPCEVSELLEEASKTAENREAFAKHAVSFLRQRGFDGLELAWHQPTADLRIQRAELIQTLRQAFEADAATGYGKRLLLSLAMPSGKRNIDRGFGDKLAELAKSVDFISLLTYNFHGSWDVVTGLNAPLFATPDEQGEDRYHNVDWVAKYYVSKGVPKHLINIGIPTFAISFTLREAKHHIIGSIITGTGKPGKYTGKAGVLSFFEVCDFLASGAELIDVPHQSVSYAVRKNQWISYDSIESVGEKACYAKTRGFGGVNIWSLDFDDFNGISCEHGMYPIVTKVYNIMQNIENDKCSNNTRSQSMAGTAANWIGSSLLKVHILLLWFFVEYWKT